METLAAVDIAQRPRGNLRTRACQLAIGGDDFVGRADEHGVVDSGGDRRAEDGLVFHIIIIKHGFVVACQLSRDGVASFLQIDDHRSCWRQPQVLCIDDSLTIDDEVVATGHHLSYVEQKGIVTSLGNVDGGLEDVAFSPLTPTALSSGDVHLLTLAGLVALDEGDTLAARVEIGEAIVIPQDAVAFAGDEHRQADLRVHLCQAA